MRGVILAVFGVVALLAAVLSKRFPFVAIAVAVIFFMIAGTLFGSANRLADSLSSFSNKRVCLEVWGLPLPCSNGETLEFDSARALGAGLHIYLRASSSSRKSHLKVAQPKAAKVEDGRLEVREAKYVQWKGKKIKRPVAAESPAVTMTIQSDN